MDRHILAPTAIEVSSLGYGCTQLTTFQDRRAAVRLLEHAFAEGITHFDVARGYGFGRAEGILGEFLQGKRDRVTVATKFGIQPPVGVLGNRLVIDAANRLLRPFPWLLRRAKSRGSSMVKTGMFTPVAAVACLETSLRELRTDYIDLLFLHEATLSDATNEPLIEILQAQVTKGKVRSLGMASGFEELQGDASLLPPDYQVIQFDNNAMTRHLPRLAYPEGRALVVHSIFKPLASLQAAVRERHEIARRFSVQIQLDLADPHVLGSLLLHHALASGAGLVLFSSIHQSRVTANVRDTSTTHYDENQLAMFTNFVDTLLEEQPSEDRPSKPEIPT